MEMTASQLFNEAFGRAHKGLHDEVAGLTVEQLLWRPQPTMNSIAFLAWHVSRTTDMFLHDRILGVPQLWFKDNWPDKIALDVVGKGTRGMGNGTGFSDEQVGEMPAAPAETYLGYVDAVWHTTEEYLANLPPAEVAAEVVREGSPNAKVYAILLQALGHIHGHRGEIGYIKGLMGIRGRV